MGVNNLQRDNIKRYKYSAVTMVSVYIVLTVLDMVRNSLSNQATIIFCSYMFVDQLTLYAQTKRIKAMIIAVVMALIILLFLYDYVIHYFKLV